MKRNLIRLPKILPLVLAGAFLLGSVEWARAVPHPRRVPPPDTATQKKESSGAKRKKNRRSRREIPYRCCDTRCWLNGKLFGKYYCRDQAYPKGKKVMVYHNIIQEPVTVTLSFNVVPEDCPHWFIVLPAPSSPGGQGVKGLSFVRIQDDNTYSVIVPASQSLKLYHNRLAFSDNAIYTLRSIITSRGAILYRQPRISVYPSRLRSP